MSQVVGLDMVTGMGFIGLEPGRLYKIGQSPKLKDQTASGNPLLLNSAEAPFTALTVYGHSTQETTTGAQLFDMSQAIDGGFILDTGVMNTGNENYNCSGFCKVSPNATYSITNVGTQSKFYYDKDQNFISYENILSSFTTPENAEYLRFNFSKTISADTIMLNVGDTALPWEPYTGGKPSPSPEYPQPIESAGDSGQIAVTVQGGNLFDSSQLDDENNFDKSFSGSGYWIIKFPVPSEDITVSVGKISNVNDCYFAVSSSYGVEDVYRQWFVHSTATNGKTSVTYSKNEHGEYIYLYFRSMMAAVQKALNECDYIQIEVGDTATQYMPYKTPQTLTAQTPGGLPGIPVSSGGNYTDESGQAWICDEADFKRGKYVKRVVKYTFDGSDGQIWRRYSDGFYIVNILEPGTYTRKPGLSNQFLVRSNAESALPGLWIGVDNSILYSVHNEFYDDSLPDYGLANWKAHLAAHPLEVMTYLETPIETDLSDEEMAAYKALHTYSPATTVSNDAGAWMKVGYKANA